METTVAVALVSGLVAIVTTTITVHSVRQMNRANAKKSNAEAVLSESGVTKTFADAAGSIAAAHSTAEAGWRQLVEGMAHEIDRFREKEKMWEAKALEYEQRIENLEEKVQDEKDECDTKIEKLRHEFELKRKADLDSYTQQIAKIFKEK